jgi:DNA-directed RNA polymerase subunit K/omega
MITLLRPEIVRRSKYAERNIVISRAEDIKLGALPAIEITYGEFNKPQDIALRESEAGLLTGILYHHLDKKTYVCETIIPPTPEPVSVVFVNTPNSIVKPTNPPVRKRSRYRK